MKIFVLYDTIDSPWGGINTFFKNFKNYVNKSGLAEIVDSPSKADIIFCAGNSRGTEKKIMPYHLRNLRSGRNLNNPIGFIFHNSCKKIVFRVDGLRLFYSNELSRNDEILIENMPYADAVVFQSAFSKKCFDSLNIKYPDSFDIIHNGTDFYLDEIKAKDFSGGIKLISCSWSNNIMKGFETIAEFSKIENVEVSHIGQWPDSIPKGGVKQLGTKKREEIAQVFADFHFLLFPSRNDACPNVILEALALGLPVLYHKSGGSPELCDDTRYGLPLPDNKDDYNKFAASLPSKYSVLLENINRKKDTFSFETCFKKYIAFFESVI